MVAYTAEFCLPYLEGSDSLCLNTGTVCEPSNAWCDLMALVEVQLQTLEDIAGRTGRAIPLARLIYEPDTPIALPNNQIPYDTVDVDTDDMADLDTFVGVVPNRNGVYEIILTVDVNFAVAPGVDRSIWAQILIGDKTIPNIIANEFGVAFATIDVLAGDNGIFSLNASALWNFTTADPVPRTIYARIDSSTATVLRSTLTVLWHSEEV